MSHIEETSDEHRENLKFTYHSPLALVRPSPLVPDLASRFEFCPAAADAKLEGRFGAIVTQIVQARPFYTITQIITTTGLLCSVKTLKSIDRVERLWQ